MSSFFKHEYWNLTRNPAMGLIFVIPMWSCYEVLAFRLNHGWNGTQRTGIDLLIIECFKYLGVNAGILFIFIVISFCVYLVLNVKSIQNVKKNPYILLGMFIESVIYAVLFGMLLGFLMNIFLIMNITTMEQSRVAVLVKNLGSGVYEEFAFRLVYISGFLVAMKKVMLKYKNLIYCCAILSSSIIFALFHHLALFNEPFQWELFLFRLIAGVAFSALFLLRGYGVTAYTHTFYNLFLMFR